MTLRKESDYEFYREDDWSSGAWYTLEKIPEEKYPELEQLIRDSFPNEEVPDWNAVDDLLDYDMDWVLQSLGIDN